MKMRVISENKRFVFLRLETVFHLHDFFPFPFQHFRTVGVAHWQQLTLSDTHGFRRGRETPMHQKFWMVMCALILTLRRPDYFAGEAKLMAVC